MDLIAFKWIILFDLFYLRLGVLSDTDTFPKQRPKGELGGRSREIQVTVLFLIWLKLETNKQTNPVCLNKLFASEMRDGII